MPFHLKRSASLWAYTNSIQFKELTCPQVTIQGKSQCKVMNRIRTRICIWMYNHRVYICTSCTKCSARCLEVETSINKIKNQMCEQCLHRVWIGLWGRPYDKQDTAFHFYQSTYTQMSIRTFKGFLVFSFYNVHMGAVVPKKRSRVCLQWKSVMTKRKNPP